MHKFLLYSLTLVVLSLSACSVAKLEARLEANPQCKDIINPKTGALMPCPGSDKSFYAAAGLVSSKAETTSTGSTVDTSTTSNAAAVQAPSKANNPSADTAATTLKSNNSVVMPCKPQIHKKSGGTLPCPSGD